MQRYEKYKDSEVAWIGEIPENWEVKRIKRLSSIKRGASPRPIANPLYFDDDGEWAWVRIADVSASERYLENTTQTLSELGASLSVKMLPNSFFLSIAGTVGKPIITKIKCCIHDGFVYFPYLNINVEYLYYIFSTGQPYLGLGKFGTQLNLNTDTVGEISIPLPDGKSIDTIVKFLDKKITEIDTLIDQKEQLLKLYEEEKKAIINRAVTKGIDSDVVMKDSNASWLKRIPQHWEVRRVGYSFGTIGSGTTPKTSESSYYDNGYIPWLNTGDLNNGYIYDTKKKITDKALEDISTLKIYPIDSLVIAMYGATIGKLGITKIETTVNQACCVLNNSDILKNKYLFYWFMLNKRHIITLSSGGGQPNISQEVIRNLKVQTPPLTEQNRIVEYIEKELQFIESKIQKTKDIITLQKEYRTALISEVVTGKIKVTEEV